MENVETFLFALFNLLVMGSIIPSDRLQYTIFMQSHYEETITEIRGKLTAEEVSTHLIRPTSYKQSGQCRNTCAYQGSFQLQCCFVVLDSTKHVFPALWIINVSVTKKEPASFVLLYAALQVLDVLLKRLKKANCLFISGGAFLHSNTAGSAE